MIRRVGWWMVVPLLAACAGGPPAPAELDTRNTRCSHCRMAVSDRRTAAQVVAPGEEPRFFDDLGCLSNWLRQQRDPLAPRTAIYVADHRTKEWLPADRAVYTRVPGLETPMGSGLVAHATAASRDVERLPASGAPVSASEVLAGRWSSHARD